MNKGCSTVASGGSTSHRAWPKAWGHGRVLSLGMRRREAGAPSGVGSWGAIRQPHKLGVLKRRKRNSLAGLETGSLRSRHPQGLLAPKAPREAPSRTASSVWQKPAFRHLWTHRSVTWPSFPCVFTQEPFAPVSRFLLVMRVPVSWVRAHPEGSAAVGLPL